MAAGGGDGGRFGSSVECGGDGGGVEGWLTCGWVLVVRDFWGRGFFLGGRFGKCQKRNMRWLLIAVFLPIFVPSLKADPLSDADREALLENLEKLRDAANERVDARFRTAIAAYRQAMSSNDAAMDLYLKCVEKVDFEDQQRKASDFREWKRREADRLSDAGLRLAMRYQLRWLVLTLQAASEKSDVAALAPEAGQIVDGIFDQADALRGQQGLLRQSVTETIFARAYEISGIEVEDWPTAPLQLAQVYDKILLPPNRKSDRTDALRATWLKRIQQEGLIRQRMADNDDGGRIGMRDAVRSPEYEKFLADTLPELQWQMELDLFRAGDQRAAALRMLQHIEKNVTHARAREWGEQFKALISPKPAAPAVVGEAEPAPAPEADADAEAP